MSALRNFQNAIKYAIFSVPGKLSQNIDLFIVFFGIHESLAPPLSFVLLMPIWAKGLMGKLGCVCRRAFFLCFFFPFLEILDGIFACPDGGCYRTDYEQHHNDDTPNPLSAILLHQPYEKHDEGYRENQNEKPAGTCHVAKVGNLFCFSAVCLSVSCQLIRDRLFQPCISSKVQAGAVGAQIKNIKNTNQLKDIFAIFGTLIAAPCCIRIG